jgi:transposase
MDTSIESTESTESPVKVRKQFRVIGQKRRMVEETFVEGASVARVARANGVNANQLFHWRKLYRDGRLGDVPGAVKLLPVVTVEAATTAPLEVHSEAGARNAVTGTIHIKLRQAQIRIEGSADAALLRLVLESLRG